MRCRGVVALKKRPQANLEARELQGLEWEAFQVRQTSGGADQWGHSCAVSLLKSARGNSALRQSFIKGGRPQVGSKSV